VVTVVQLLTMKNQLLYFSRALSWNLWLAMLWMSWLDKGPLNTCNSWLSQTSPFTVGLNHGINSLFSLPIYGRHLTKKSRDIYEQFLYDKIHTCELQEVQQVCGTSML
jgi:hypothetical protein